MTTKNIHRLFRLTMAAALATLALLLVGVYAVRADPGVIYVDADAPGPIHNGLSWTTAFTNPQNALAVALYGDEIWVAEGVYYPDQGSGQTNNAPASRFTLIPGVALYGGFGGYGISETLRTQRAWTVHVTVLSGDIDANDWNTDTNGIAETWADIQGNNAYHVVNSSSVTETARLDGFTITAGRANSSDPDDSGGGMINATGRPTLANVTFSGNWAATYGGGMYNNMSSPALTNVIFSGNRASWGGAMYNNGQASVSSPTLTDVTFNGNEAARAGGGIYNNGRQAGQSSPALINVTFSNNSARWGGAMYNNGEGGVSSPTLITVTFSTNLAVRVDNQGGDGGAMYNAGFNGVCSPVLTNTTFGGNSATRSGGAMYNDGNGGVSNPVLTNVTFSDNLALWGGAMYNDGRLAGRSNPTLTRVIFSSNEASQSGGGMYNDGNGGVSNPILTNVTFSDNLALWGGGMYNNGSGGVSSPIMTNVIFNGNSAVRVAEVGGMGGAMYNNGKASGASSPTLINVAFSGNAATNSGGGMYNDGYGGASSPVLTNVTLSGNQAAWGGGMLNDGRQSGASAPILVNNILWGNAATSGGSQIFNYSATATLSYSLIQGGCPTGATCGAGMLNTDPQFIAPIAASSAPTTTGNYRLQAASPAIDMGDRGACPAGDLDDKSRADLRCDMGAYERQYSDGNTVIKNDFAGGVPYSFGPTWISVTLSAPDTGVITATKHITYPGGTYHAGEMPVTWWITGNLTAGFPLTLSLCYTDAEVAGLNENSLEMFRWVDGEWIAQSATPGPAYNCVTLAGVTGLSAWTLKDTSVGASTPTVVAVRALSARGSFFWGGGLFLMLSAAYAWRRRLKRSAFT